MTDISPKLKAAMFEVKKILERHDIMGCVYLADGEGHGEYLHHVHESSWSTLRDLSRPDKPKEIRMHAKLHGKSKPIETNMTVNAILVLCDMIGTSALWLIEMSRRFESAIGIEKEPGRFL